MTALAVLDHGSSVLHCVEKTLVRKQTVIALAAVTDDLALHTLAIDQVASCCLEVKTVLAAVWNYRESYIESEGLVEHMGGTLFEFLIGEERHDLFVSASLSVLGRSMAVVVVVLHFEYSIVDMDSLADIDWVDDIAIELAFQIGLAIRIELAVQIATGSKAPPIFEDQTQEAQKEVWKHMLQAASELGH